MAHSSPRRQGEDSLNDSWVVFNQEGAGDNGNRPLSVHDGNMEKLLMEAQRESRSTSRGSSQGSSPKCPHSPGESNSNSTPGSINGSDKSQTASLLESGSRLGQGTEWIWDWSSRPEPLPPKGFHFKHPEHARLSIRKSKAMKSRFLSAEVLSIFIPSLIITNLLTLGIGIYIGLRVFSPRSS